MANIIRHNDQNRELARRTGRLDPFRLMEEMLTRSPFDWMSEQGGLQQASFAPSFDVKERDDAIVLRADLPGVKDEDVDISLTGNRLTISGRREHEEEHDDGDRYYTYERSFGSFTRSFTLPEDVDADNIDADLVNGVLAIHMPKKPESKPRKISLKDKVKSAFKGGH